MLRHGRHQGDARPTAAGSSRRAELSGADHVLFRRNSVTGAVEAVPWQAGGIELNADLHAN